jgi:hypothetical protein
MSNAADVLRTEQINLRLGTEELARLERLAAHLAISPQSLLRLLLKRAADEFEREGRWPIDGAAANPAKKSRK